MGRDGDRAAEGDRVGGRWRGGLVALVLCLAAVAPPAPAQQGGGVLAECIGLSPLLDDIHACLDNYLDVMDDNLADIAAFIERSLDGEALAAFGRSQSAFAAYRRDNCLWYLAFSTPRGEAEQIAKNCLARMSIERLTELQRLIALEGGDTALGGHYVYGPERNTFRPCGSEARYWVEGDAGVVGQLQQDYLNTATDELQLLFATLRGTLDDEAQTAAGHDGVLRARELIELRVPRESDCRLPVGGPDVAVPTVELPEPVADTGPDDGDDEPFETEEDEPEQRLVAYFGAWLADCTERGGRRVCALSTPLEPGSGAASAAAGDGADATPRLMLSRRDGPLTSIVLRFPEREIDTPAKLSWRIDEEVLGDLLGSTIRVDESATEQLVEERRYVDETLLPQLVDGGTLVVEVLAAVDDERGQRFSATLMGLTRALAFADDFVRDSGGL